MCMDTLKILLLEKKEGLAPYQLETLIDLVCTSAPEVEFM